MLVGADHETLVDYSTIKLIFKVMKKNPRSMRIPPHGVKKFLHQMKFTLLFVMLFCFYAEASSQKVTLKVKNMDLYSVLLQLKNQTGVRILCRLHKTN